MIRDDDPTTEALEAAKERIASDLTVRLDRFLDAGGAAPPASPSPSSGAAAASSDDELDDPSLSQGLAGLALFFHHLDPRSGSDPAATAARALDAACDRLGSHPLRPGLFGGFAGVAWVVAHTADGEGVESPLDDPLDEIDRAVEAYADADVERSFDLVSGLAGVAVYALERLPRPSAQRTLEAIVIRMRELAVDLDGGVAWLTSPLEMLPSRRSRYPNGCFDAGVAHGVAGVVPLLAAIARWGIAPGVAEPLAEHAVDWLLAQELPASSHSRFPAEVYRGVSAGGTRLAWCYGDAGIACALAAAARALNVTRWQEAAVRIGLAAAGRDRRTSGVVDAGLCHGSAGLARTFQRLHDSTGADEFARASARWLADALSQQRPERGAGGFRVEENGKEVECAGFLEGAAGIGLALGDALETRPRDWDRALVLSTRLPEQPVSGASLESGI